MLSSTQHKVFVFIDPKVQDYHHLNQGVIPGAKSIILDSAQDGIEQITAVLDDHRRQGNKINALHLVSHGSPGCLYLGKTPLNLNTLNHYNRQLKRWRNALTPTAEILIYGCNVAQSTDLLQQLHQLTGASIAATATPTGNPQLGGNWKLEFNLGTIRNTLAIHPQIQMAYGGVLADFVVTNTDDVGPGSLRQAIADSEANAEDDTITFDASLAGQTITLASTIEIDNPNSLTLTGPGADQLTISGGGIGDGNDNNGPVFDATVAEAASVTISGVTIADGNPVGARRAGGIEFNGPGALILDAVVIENNAGIGVRNNEGTLTLTNSTIRGNGFHGVAIRSSNNTIANNIIVDNGTETDEGSGLDIGGGADPITNTQITGNFIGTDANNTAGLGNFADGITLGNTTGILVQGNTLSSNGQHGIAIGNTTATQLQGNTIVSNTENGINLNNTTGNVIGGLAPDQRNIISGNQENGINITNANVANTIEGNLIGLAADGVTALPNVESGINLNGNNDGVSNQVINDNTISGNTANGISLAPGVTAITITANRIGTNVEGTTAVGNGARGIELLNAPANIIQNNVIGNNTQGIFIGNGATGNIVQSNFIGLAADGVGNIGNDEEGIRIQNAPDNIIGGDTSELGNRIAFNGLNGVTVAVGASIENLIQGNQIFSNGGDTPEGIGIDLGGNGVTANDEGDVDDGPNNLQNFPVLLSAEPVGDGTTVIGTLNSAPNTTYQVALFSNDPAIVDGSGLAEGQVFRGIIEVTTDANGNAGFIENIPGTGNLSGQLITATATDPNNNTSEFSVSAEIRSPNVTFAHVPLEGDPPVPGTPVNNLTQLEGDEATVDYVYTVSLDKPSAQNIVFDYATTSDTATVEDFAPNSGNGSLTFNGITPAQVSELIADPTFLDDQLTQTLTVQVIGERLAELDDEFTVTLTTANDVVFLDEINTVTGIITNDDAAPVVDLNGTGEGINTTTNFTEGTVGGIPITDSVTVSDDDDPNLVSATITITNPLDAEEALSVTGTLPATITATPTTGTEIVLTGEAPPADYAAAIAAITYDNTSEGPDLTDRVVTVVVNDGINDSEIATSTIAITAINDAPVNTVPSTLTTDEDTPLTLTGANGISILDVDSRDGEIQVDLSVTSGILTLATVEGLTITAGADSTNAVTFTGVLANVNAALEGLVYAPNLNFDESDNLEIVTNDLGNTGEGGEQTATSTVPITVTPINDLPIVDLDTTVADSINFATGFVERRGATPISNGTNVAIFDPDNPTMQSATVTLTNFAEGDILEIDGALPGGITSDNSTPGVLTLTGEATVAEYEQAIAQVFYNNTSNNPATEARVIEVTANDGLGSSNPAAVTQITIFPVNDPPQVDLDGTTDGTNFVTSFTEGGEGAAISNPGNTVVADSDSTAITTAIITLTNPLDPGAETLGVNGELPAGITAGTYNGSTGQLILTGEASLADYQTAISQVVYENVSASPNLTPRLVEVVVNDSINDSNIASTTINITPVNAPPTANPDNITTRLNTAIAFNITHNDFDPDGEIDPSTVDFNPTTEEIDNTANLFNQGEISIDDQGYVTLIPAEGFTGEIDFSYTVRDNDGAVSEAADVTVNVIPELLGNQPPITANNITSIIGNDAVQVPIPALSGVDLDEGDSITGFRLTALPLNGELFVGGTAAEIGQVIAPDAVESLTFTPTPGFSGVASFQYVAIDSNGAADPNPATIAIPVNFGNQPPVAADLIAAAVPLGATAAPVPALSAVDGDGTIVSYEITRLPQKGTLLLGEQPLEAGIPITPEQAQTLVFVPGADFTGDSTFQYTAIDDAGARDESPATVFLPPDVGNNLEPVAADIVAPVLSNSATGVTLPALSASDIDGSITNFVIKTLPQSGELLFNGEAVVVDQEIPAEQADSLTYTPNVGFSGQVSFRYTATDDQGAVDVSPATYYIPVTFSNLPPVPNNPAIPRFKNVSPITALPGLTATDADGTANQFTITELPISGQLLLDGTPVELNQVISAEQANQLSFDPDIDFSGLARFTFTATDDAGGTSLFTGNGSLFVIPNLLPIAEDTAGSSTPNTLPTIVPTPNATDIDGTVERFSIAELPEAAEGRLLLNNTPVTNLSQVENLTQTQFAELLFIPNLDFNGNAVFTYVATDNNGQNSAEPASITIPVYVPPASGDGVDLPEVPPTVEPITVPDIPNDGSTIEISLVSTNNVSEIATFTITEIPTLAQGQLFLDGVVITSLEQVALLTVEQASQLTFVPAPTFSGEISLSYTATTIAGVSSSSASIVLIVPTFAEGFAPVSSDLSAEFISLTSIQIGIVQSITTIIESVSVNLVEFTLSAVAGETLVGSSSSEELLGSDSSDVLLGFGNNDNLFGAAGADTADGGDGDDFLNGNEGDDQLFGGSGQDTLRGGAGNDSLFGASSDLLIADVDPDDLLIGDAGDDFMAGNTGSDTITGGVGDDSGFGGQGDDCLYGDEGDDELFGDDGNDKVVGGPGEDRLFGNTGDDTLSGGEGNDQLFGGKDNDLVFGDAGNDIIFGDLGNDSLFGNEGSDILNGGEGNDTLVGGLGNDQLDGNEGADVLFGDLGSDVFVLASVAEGDIIVDFTNGQDTFKLPEGVTFEDLTIIQVEEATFIQLDDQLLVTVENVMAELITEADFVI